MFAVFSLSLMIILFLNYGSSQTENQTFTQDDDSVNDTIIQLFHNCKCIAYYQCRTSNKILGLGVNNNLPTNITCQNKFYLCCIADNQTPNTEITTESIGTTPRTIPPVPEDILPQSHITNRSCGIATTFLNIRILNPETDSATAIDGEAPWMVEIFEARNNGAYIFRCSGSLIHPRVVLTVQHYLRSVTENSLKIIANSNTTFKNIGEQPENERNVLKIIKHPEYYSGGLHNDIALIILDKEYDVINNPIRPICLPDINESFEGTKCIVTGWGKNDKHLSVPLKKVDVPIVNFQTCQDLLRKTRLGLEFILHSSFLCAGGEAGKDTCLGDGGSPLFCVGKDYRYVQIGIVSWGVNCGVINEPGLYTNVAKFKDWIKEELKKNRIDLE